MPRFGTCDGEGGTWVPWLLGAAWLSTHVLLKRAAVWHGRTTDEMVETQRLAGYAYKLSVESPVARAGPEP